MTSKDKELLIKDLCCRLPYNVKCYVINDNRPYTLSSISNDYDDILFGFKEQKKGFNMEVYVSEVVPYLFPRSSMTEEQRNEYNNLCAIGTDENGDIAYFDTYESIDYLYKIHVDVKNLISKDRAIDATNLNIY